MHPNVGHDSHRLLFPEERGPDPPRPPRRPQDRGHLWGLMMGIKGVPEGESSEVYVCPACGGRMKIAGVPPRASGLPRLLTFQCLDCKEVITIEDD